MSSAEQENGIERLLQHIENVQRGCKIVGMKLIKNGECKLGKELIANGMIHDHSKFYGLQWEAFCGTKTQLLQDAIRVHKYTNFHHPEYWMGIKNMPDVYLYECVIDWWARSHELGGYFPQWINDVASKIYGFQPPDPVNYKIQKVVDLLIEKSF